MHTFRSGRGLAVGIGHLEEDDASSAPSLSQHPERTSERAGVLVMPFGASTRPRSLAAGRSSWRGPTRGTPGSPLTSKTSCASTVRDDDDDSRIRRRAHEPACLY
ncbi:hypothetical protein K438DRAFT_1968051 [Mycena galopus ATCC 62051]|nr:hypothetical protein K438DRAFT_1968051 [Mycena galopus ATCC 62051]